jgi:hypothetical protein
LRLRHSETDPPTEGSQQKRMSHRMSFGVRRRLSDRSGKARIAPRASLCWIGAAVLVSEPGAAASVPMRSRGCVALRKVVACSKVDFSVF